MYSFEFEDIQSAANANLLTGRFLWIWHADKIPPHIGISSGGRYFSLKVNGKDTDLEVNNVLSIAGKKKIPLVLVELKNEFTTSELNRVFSCYKKAVSGESTCLTPVRELIALESSVGQLSELLKYLFEKQEAGTVFGLNLAADFRGILAYGKAEIEERLRKLEDAKRKQNISPIS